jgi:hypothetical protein
MWDRTKGRESEILKVMCERGLAMLEVNKKFGPEKEVFSASFNTTGNIVRRIAAVKKPGRKWDEWNGDSPELYRKALELAP